VTRLERLVTKYREQLQRYIAPKSVESREDRKNKLRGAARPWTEVMAAENFDHHALPENLIEKYGQLLCSESIDARKFRDALIELAKVKFDASDYEAGCKLCTEAISIDATDIRGAGLLALARGVPVPTLTDIDSVRCIPIWTRFVAHPDNFPIPADSINSYAIFCLAYPESFDACIEYTEEIDPNTTTPGGILEALLLHHHLRTIFTDSLFQVRRKAAQVILQKTTHLSSKRTALPSSPPPESHHIKQDHLKMYTTMFFTALDMGIETQGGSQ